MSTWAGVPVVANVTVTARGGPIDTTIGSDAAWWVDIEPAHVTLDRGESESIAVIATPRVGWDDPADVRVYWGSERPGGGDCGVGGDVVRLTIDAQAAAVEFGPPALILDDITVGEQVERTITVTSGRGDAPVPIDAVAVNGFPASVTSSIEAAPTDPAFALDVPIGGARELVLKFVASDPGLYVGEVQLLTEDPLAGMRVIATMEAVIDVNGG